MGLVSAAVRRAISRVGASATSATWPRSRDGRPASAPVSSASTRCTPRNPARIRIRARTFRAAGGSATRCISASRTCRASRPTTPRSPWPRKRADHSTTSGSSTAIRSTPSNSRRWNFSWARFGADARFDAFIARGASALRQYALYCALAERHGGGWTTWPSEYKRPDSPSVTRFAAAQHDRLRFHSWLQWLLDEQLAGRRRGDRAAGRLGHRLRSWWRGRVGVAGHDRARCARRRAAGCVQRGGPGLGASAVRPVEVARRRLRAARADGACRARPLRRAADRSRDGPVPAVLDPRGRRTDRRHVRPLPRQRAARHRGPRERAGGRRSWARTSAPSRTRCASS